MTVSVYPPESVESPHVPFFKATLTPSRFFPSFPISTNWIPLNTILVQPPLPQGEQAVLCGTDVWQTFKTTASTHKARLAWIDVPDDGSVMQRGYWPVTSPWRFGLWLEDALLDIPRPDEST